MATLWKVGRPFNGVFGNSSLIVRHRLNTNCLKFNNVCMTVRHLYSSRKLLSDRRYSEKHEWVLVQSNIGTVGITDYAQNALGDVVYAQLPEVGSEFSKDEECGALESVKAASEVYTPVSGKIVGKNITVEEKPALINTSCYDEGWLFKIELSKPEEFQQLMNDSAYEKFLKAQEE